MKRKIDFPPSKKFYGKRYLLTAVKYKAHTKNQYINSVRKVRGEKVSIKTLKKKRPKGYKYGIYARLKK